MVTGPITIGATLVVRQSADNKQVILNLGQRGQDLGQIVSMSDALRSPVSEVHPIGYEDERHSLW
jgi:hypothetical protein